jgi:hypothetical protein
MLLGRKDRYSKRTSGLTTAMEGRSQLCICTYILKDREKMPANLDCYTQISLYSKDKCKIILKVKNQTILSIIGLYHRNYFK